MRSEARHSPEAEYTVWWLLLCRAAERAARAAAFREAADIVWRIHEQPVEDIVDALRARGEGGEG